MRTTDKVAAVGVGYSTTGRSSGLTSWQLAIQASMAALDDAGDTVNVQGALVERFFFWHHVRAPETALSRALSRRFGGSVAGKPGSNSSRKLPGPAATRGRRPTTMRTRGAGPAN